MPEPGEYPDALPHGPVRGRGAPINPANRFESTRLHVLGDHLDALAAERACEQAQAEGDASTIELTLGERQEKTTVLADQSQTIINPIDSPDLPMKWSLNPYRGCEHGCIYCYARPTHEYLGFNSGLDFETKIMAKFDAADLLRKQLSKKSWQPQPIMMAGVTDIYQPIEAKLGITRQCLQVLAQARQPGGLITKNRLVTRDLDLLQELAQHQAVRVAVSITTLDAELAMKMEPRTSTPRDRLRAVSDLASAGVPVSVMVAPILPGLTDREVPAILKAAADAGATHAGYVLLRLPHQVKALFLSWLEKHYPQRASHVESLIRDTREGELYNAKWRTRQRGQGQVAQQIESIFRVFARKYKLDQPLSPLSGDAFRRPGPAGQMPLF